MSNRILRSLCTAGLSLALLSCEDERPAGFRLYDRAAAPEPALLSVAAPEALQAEAAAAETRFRIRTAHVTLVVEDVDSATARVRRIAEEAGGRVEAFEHQDPERGVRRNTLSLRVPESKLDEAVRRVQEVGRVEHLVAAERDVTEQVVDLDLRLRNLRRLEERLLRLLETRTARLEDILAAERELARVRQEIERTEGQRRSLEQQSAWSRLDVELHEPYPAVAGSAGGIGARLADAIVQAGENLVSTIAVLIAALGVILPLGAIGAGLYYLWRRFRRTRRRAGPASSGSTAG